MIRKSATKHRKIIVIELRLNDDPMNQSQGCSSASIVILIQGIVVGEAKVPGVRILEVHPREEGQNLEH
jgi:hypothetical protein